MKATKFIDGEERRYELAKAAMQGMVSFWQASYNESSNRSYGGSLKVLVEMIS